MAAVSSFGIPSVHSESVHKNGDSGAQTSLIPPETEKYGEAIVDFFAQNREASRAFVDEAQARNQWLMDHVFRPSGDYCEDGRVGDFPDALGLPMGIMEPYRSAGVLHGSDSWTYLRRKQDMVTKVAATAVNGEPRPQRVMNFLTVHHSKIRPADASCAAWKHDTRRARRAMQRRADELNDGFGRDDRTGQPQQLIALPVLINTDWDSITIVGSIGDLDTDAIKPAWERLGLDAAAWIATLLRPIFPASWPPLANLEPEMRERFYLELAERVDCNLRFAKAVIDSARPLELLDHQETLIAIGRHFDWYREYNRIFLVDDNNPGLFRMDLPIALKYVARNVIRAAMESGRKDWRIPIVINVPYREDYRLTALYVRNLGQRIRARIKTLAPDVADWLRNPVHGLPTALRCPELDRALDGLFERVSICTSVSSAATRLFEVVE